MSYDNILTFANAISSIENKNPYESVEDYIFYILEFAFLLFSIVFYLFNILFSNKNINWPEKQFIDKEKDEYCDSTFFDMILPKGTFNETVYLFQINIFLLISL